MSFRSPLPLRVETPAAWTKAALADPEGLLSDHAHCEKKAALAALSLLHAFPGEPRPALLLAKLAEEELNHFRRVLEALQRFGWSLRPDGGNRYAQGLLAIAEADRKGRKGHDPLLDRLLIAALIEARSCERLHLLERSAGAHAELGKAEWLAFLFELERCEAGHALAYLSLAEGHAGPAARARLDWWLDREAEVVADLPWRAAVH
ncbi:MAG TPA: tRNA isopentenyl-2-thiomethyl-A-37 hydroxylase MiaE [Holophagaceae bacterium]|jgi:tRNA-(ms[2]io[6]A)-hydroxylase|nr:tRNA isopentenyl-2-thiomethyl-A-37 hydroxylase MiaE [Holophagaceae bacterium]